MYLIGWNLIIIQHLIEEIHTNNYCINIFTTGNYVRSEITSEKEKPIGPGDGSLVLGFNFVTTHTIIIIF